MPRAIVFVKGGDWEYAEKKLKNILSQKDKTLAVDNATILEFYLESFGNPDFVLSLWSTNIEQLKSSILYIRKECKVTTTTIIGIDEEERKFREHELKTEISDLENIENRPDQVIQKYIKRTTGRIEQLRDLLATLSVE